MNAIYIAGLVEPKERFPSHKGRGFLSIEEYHTIARKIVSHYLKGSKTAQIMCCNEDFISSLATAIMMADWKYDPNKQAGSCSIKTYRYGIAINIIKTYFKKTKVQKNNNISIDKIDSINKKSKDVGGYVSVNVEELLAYGDLSEKESSILKQHFIDNLSYVEIGKKVGCSKQNIHIIVSKALQKIREGVPYDYAVENSCV